MGTSPPAEVSRDDEEGLALHIRGDFGVRGASLWNGWQEGESEEVRAGRDGRDRGDAAEWGYGVTDLLVREKGTKNMRKSLVTYPGSPGGLHLP